LLPISWETLITNNRRSTPSLEKLRVRSSLTLFHSKDDIDSFHTEPCPSGSSNGTNLQTPPEDANRSLQENAELDQSKPDDVKELAVNSIGQIADDMEVDPNSTRCKRRRTSPPPGLEIDNTELRTESLNKSGGGCEAETTTYVAQQASGPGETVGHHVGFGQNPAPVKSQDPLVKGPEVREDVNKFPLEASGLRDDIASKATKVLKYNPATGTIGSPPAKKASKASDLTTKAAPGKRGRKKASKLVIIEYGQDAGMRSTIGAEIEAIMRIPPAKPEKLPNTKANSNINKPESSEKADGPPKITHPFFLGKAARPPPSDKHMNVAPLANDAPKSSGLSKKSSFVSMVGPHSLAHKRSDKMDFAGFAGFGNASAKLMKFPGALEPAWPAAGMVHARGLDQDYRENITEVPLLKQKDKKSKRAAVEVVVQEDILRNLATDLAFDRVADDLRNFDLDAFPEPSKITRLPTRHFETGHDLQSRIRKELSTQIPQNDISEHESSGEDELQAAPRAPSRIHPAIIKYYSTIAGSLSAFDRSQCETQSWAQKYAPDSAETVLQPGREALILRDWLQALTVIAVDAGLDIDKAKKAGRIEIPKKKKRKGNKLDGFVVSSDEEAEEMDEIADSAEELAFWGGQGPAKKTLIKGGDRTGSGYTKRPGNAVMISGPHGSSKTSAVYAVAKELGFEVFEINSGSRRNGKDIMDKVGDMTRNHLVQRISDEPIGTPADEDLQRISEALDNDLQSGRQATMQSFFQAKTNSKLKPKPKKPEHDRVADKTANSGPKGPAKQQKQSLILLEEVDVLFEDDKLFWATVVALIAQSKRPVIMTCNDESLIPFHTLDLHAIIRFAAPPVDLAVDYMLLLAANEGHALRRKAVKALYEAKNFDLRASITELDFWCQMALGDRKGGLEWFYPRWPPGSDVDQAGNTIRAVSEGTYKMGMGWLGRDDIIDSQDLLGVEEGILRESWNNWELDVGDWHNTLDLGSWAVKTRDTHPVQQDRLAALEIYQGFADSLSVADICTGHGLTSGYQVRSTSEFEDKQLTNADYIGRYNT
jgi:DNA polymerase III delta prime subunit